MTRPIVCRLFMSLVASAAICAAATPADAQQSHETAREAGPVIRHQLLYRSTRFELAPWVGMTVDDAYIRNGLVGAQLSYHLTNSWSVSLMGGYAPLHFDTDLRGATEEKLANRQPGRFEELSYSYVKALGGLEVSYAPIIGKFSLFQSAIVDYDIHLIGGFGGVYEATETAAESGQADEQLEGFRPAPELGLGGRLFLGEGISANVQLRDFLYSRSEVSSGSSDPELKNNLMVSVGLSFFFPSDVKISR